MQVVYAKKPFPEQWFASIFLAGPTPRDAETPSWRPEALRLLEEIGVGAHTVVFVPEDAGGEWGSGPDAYVAQVEWERRALDASDIIVFWVPREMEHMPALTTNVEFGLYVTSGRVVLGAPDWAKSVKYLAWTMKTEQHEEMHPTLEATLRAAVRRIEEIAGVPIGQPAMDEDALVTGYSGASVPVLRRGGERFVPLHIWHTVAFQEWYLAACGAGNHPADNRLDDARVLWQFKPRQEGPPFAFILWVSLWVTAEGRHKSNECVFFRPDTSMVVLYSEPEGRLQATPVVLVREFRSPGRNSAGFVLELPGGSAWEHTPARTIAIDEVREETGLTIDPHRLRHVGSRQVAGTLSSHHADVFAVKITPAEMEQAKAIAAAGVAHGVGIDTERTYVEVRTLGEILRDRQLDWATVGMIVAAITT